MSAFTNYRAHIGVNPDRFFKTTLFQSPRMLLGMDCLEPGQSQLLHKHAGRDKFYYVIEGTGTFTIGDEIAILLAGDIAWAAADIPHSVFNHGDSSLIMLIGMAPEPD